MKSSSEGVYTKMLFIVWPLGAMYHACKHFRSTYSPNLFWAFCIFFGFAFGYAKELAGTSDIYAYVTELKELNAMNATWENLGKYYESTGEVDLLRTFLAFLISRFTSESYVLTTVYAAILGFFLSRNMFYIFSKLKGKLSFFVMLGMMTIFMIDPIWNINGFRFNTAVQVFIYGLLPYLMEGKRIRLLWSFITPFVFHFSFYVAIALLAIYLLVGNRYVIYFYIFWISIFITNLNVGAAAQLASALLPEKVLDRASSYTDDEKVSDFRRTSGGKEATDRFYVYYYRSVLQYFSYVMLTSLFFNDLKKYRRNKFFTTMLSATLIFYALANILSAMPSGGRYFAISNILLFVFLVIHFNQFKVHSTTRMLGKIAVPVLLLYLLVGFRESLYFVSQITLLGNPIIAAFNLDNLISINDFLK